MSQPAKKVVLALETAIRGGSIALFVDGDVVRTLSGNATMSRAEELVFGIDRLMRNSFLKRTDITMIAVSNGPGSYTGERIGISTAMGLAAALDVPVIGVELLVAMRHAASHLRTTVAAVPVGKKDVAWAETETDTDNGVPRVARPSIGEFAEFYDAYRDVQDRALVVHEELYQAAVEHFPNAFDGQLVNAGRDLAVYVGLEALKRDNLVTPRPLYLLNHSRASSLF